MGYFTAHALDVSDSNFLFESLRDRRAPACRQLGFNAEEIIFTKLPRSFAIWQWNRNALNTVGKAGFGH